MVKEEFDKNLICSLWFLKSLYFYFCWSKYRNDVFPFPSPQLAANGLELNDFAACDSICL